MSPDGIQKRGRAPVDVFRYRDYREFLAAFYSHQKPAGLSFRSFAKTVGLGAPNYLKLVIDGKRNLSPEMAKRFAAACHLNGESIDYFVTLVLFNQSTSHAEQNELHERLSRFARFRAAQRLDLAESEYHASWYIPVIRELVACRAFVEDTTWIARSLVPAITERQAGQALDVLQQLGLLERDEEGRLRQATRSVTTGEQARGLHIRNYHTQMISQAVQAMHELPAAERHIAALTLSVSPATLAAVHQRALEFREELVALCDADPAPSQVVQLNLQIFPVATALSDTRVSDPASGESGTGTETRVAK